MHDHFPAGVHFNALVGADEKVHTLTGVHKKAQVIMSVELSFTGASFFLQLGGNSMFIMSRLREELGLHVSSRYVQPLAGLHVSSRFVQLLAGLHVSSRFVQLLAGLYVFSRYVQPLAGLHVSSRYVQPLAGLHVSSTYVQPLAGLHVASTYVQPLVGLLCRVFCVEAGTFSHFNTQP